jgi:hypothetical protein
MTAKKEVPFSFDDCSCMEMMAQMLAQSQGQQEMGNACAEMMAQFVDPQDSSREFFEMMASCCDLQEEEDKIIKKA